MRCNLFESVRVVVGGKTQAWAWVHLRKRVSGDLGITGNNQRETNHDRQTKRGPTKTTTHTLIQAIAWY